MSDEPQIPVRGSVVREETTALRAAADTGTVDADNPWPGLLPFREADQVWFQGF